MNLVEQYAKVGYFEGFFLIFAGNLKKYYIVVGRERLFFLLFFLGQVNMLVLLTFFTLRAWEACDAIWSEKQTIYNKSFEINVYSDI